MKKLKRLDILVVYSAYTAASADAKKKSYPTPFAGLGVKNDLDHAYAYFLTACRQMKLKAALTTSADIIGPGQCSSYWLFKRSGWTKVKQPASASVIFDKFSPCNRRQKHQRELMFSSPEIRPFNQPDLYQLFFDKHSTYEFLTDMAIPSVVTSKTSINDLLWLLKQHRFQADFGDSYVLKDRFGSAGNHVYQIKSGQEQEIDTILKLNPQKQFILQPLLKFDHEIRLIFMGDKIVQTYIRTAPADGFCCNDHQGGASEYILESNVPLKVLEMAHSLVERLPSDNSLYALDFIVSHNGNVYLLEGNTGPGLNWNSDNKIDEVKSHQLIEIIVAELAKRVKLNRPRFFA